MFTEEIETITVNENETTRTCRNCKELLPMDAFTKNKECINGREQTCRKCRAERKKLSEAFRKSEGRRREQSGPSKGLPMLPKILPPRLPGIKARTAPVEPPKLPVGMPPGITDPVSGSDDFPLTKDFICNNDFSITVDFSCYIDLLTSVSSKASQEFRTPAMQILYMLSKFNDKC